MENCRCNKRDSVRSESLSPGKEAAGTVWLRQSYEVLLFMQQLCSQAVVRSRCSLPTALGAVLASLWLPRGKDAVGPEAPAWGSVVLVTLM